MNKSVNHIDSNYWRSKFT